MSRPVRILHAHSTFSLGGKEARAVRLMNAFGDAAEHTILSAMPDQLGARDAIGPHVKASFPTDAPSLIGKPGPARYLRLARYMRRFDLVLTYNWGSFDAVMARRLLGGPPLIHHEDGFNQDEVVRLKRRRNWFRWAALPGARRLVVPSARLGTIARTAWAQPARKVERIPNGIAVQDYGSPAPGAIPGLVKREGEIVVGTIAGLRAVKNLPRLVRAFAGMQYSNSRLVIVGEGPERERIMAEAQRLGVADRLLLPGFLANPATYVGHFDIFALSSDSEQFPISLVEAMAAGLPAVTTAAGDIQWMVSADNRPLIVEAPDEAGFTAALDDLAREPERRHAVGLANREKSVAEFGEESMIARYARLYGDAIGRPDAFAAPWQ